MIRQDVHNVNVIDNLRLFFYLLSYAHSLKIITYDIGYVPYVVTTTPFLFHECDLPNQTIYRICNIISSTTGATCGAGSVYFSGALKIIPSFWWGSCCLVFSFLCCVFCTICLFVYLSLAMALSVYFPSMSLTVPLVYFVPLLWNLSQNVNHNLNSHGTKSWILKPLINSLYKR